MRCSVCSKGFYQKCSTVLKGSAPDIHRKCEKCTNIQQNRTYQSTNRLLRGSTNSLPSKPVPATSWNKLKIYQWNGDGIRPNFIELCDHLLKSDIDVLAVQESKLRGNWSNYIHWRLCHNQKRSKQHSWRRSTTLHPNGLRVRENTLFRKGWHGDPVHSYRGY